MYLKFAKYIIFKTSTRIFKNRIYESYSINLMLTRWCKKQVIVGCKQWEKLGYLQKVCYLPKLLNLPCTNSPNSVKK